jgi:hypothetical protein
MYLLITYTHDSELQTITAPPLISRLYKSLYAKSSPACSIVFTRRFLVTDFNGGDSSASRAQVFSSQSPTVFKITSRYGPRRKHGSPIAVEACLPRRCVATVGVRTTETPFPTVPLLLRVDSLPWEPVCLRSLLSKASTRYIITHLLLRQMQSISIYFIKQNGLSF